MPKRPEARHVLFPQPLNCRVDPGPTRRSLLSADWLRTGVQRRIILGAHILALERIGLPNEAPHETGPVVFLDSFVQGWLQRENFRRGRIDSGAGRFDLRGASSKYPSTPIKGLIARS